MATLINIILLMSMVLLNLSCNNPSGGSVVSHGHSPLLEIPGPFSYTQIRAADGTVNLTWRKSPRTSEYRVYTGPSSSTATTLQSSCTGLRNSCSITGLDANTVHFINVVASNAAGTRNISSIGVALSIGTFDITSSSLGDAELTVAWSSAVNATNYNLIYGTSPNSLTSQVTNITSPYTLQNLNNGRTYYFRVVATNTQNGYVLSNSEGNETPVGAPNAPTGLSLVASPSRMSFSWDVVPGALQYKIFKGTSSGSLTQIATSPTNSYVDSTVTDGTTYFYAVMANNTFDSPLSSEVSARSISDFSMTSVANGGVSNSLVISWPGTTGAASYNIRYGTNPASLSSTVTNVTSPYSLNGLTGGSTYYFRVVAVNAIGAGTSINSLNQLSGIPVAALSAPSNLTAAAGQNQVSLSWNPVAGAISYEIFRGTSTGVYTSLQSNVVGNTFTDTTAVNGTSYFYTVRAYNGMNSPASNESTGKPISSFALSTVSTVSATSLQISWAGSTGADAYDVRYGTASGTYTTTVSNVTSPFTLTGLTANTNHFIVVRGRNAVGSGTSFQSNQLSGLTKTIAPVGLVAATTPGNVSLNWSDTPGAASYNVYRGTSAGSYSTLATSVATSNYVDATVTDGTTYYYVVTAFNGSESLNSTEVATRSISSFNLTSLVSPGSTSLTVTWPAVTGAASYDVRYGTSTGAYTTTLSSRTSPFTITGLTSGQTYYVIVVARNAVGAGSSVNSDELSEGTPTGAPANVAATVLNDQITVSWNAMTGATSYKVYRGTTSGTHTLLASNVLAANYVDSTVVPGTQYYYVVKSFNGSDSVNSAEVTGKAIAPFALTSGAPLSPTSAQIVFPTTAGADSYNVRWGTTSGTYTGSSTGVASPATIASLAANTTYYVVAEGRNTTGSGTGRYSSELSFKTPTGAPASLAAVSTPGQVSLSWNAVSGTTNYKVFRGTTSGSLTEIANGVATNSYTDTTVANGTTYFYTVKSFNGSDSVDSNEVSTRPIEAFTLASVSSPSSTSIQVSWNTVNGASAYDVRWGTVSGTYTGTTLNAVSPYTLSGLAANTTYFVIVRAKNAIGAGTNLNSTEASLKTATGAPTSLTASASPGQASLSWVAAAGATSYKIFRGTSSGSYSEIAANVSGTSYLDTTVTDGAVYYYTVRGFNGSDSALSNEVSIRPIGDFLLTSASPASATSINLAWENADGATRYDVRYGTSSGVYLGTVSNVTSPYTLSALSANTQYFFSVRASNTTGAGTTYDSNERNTVTGTGSPSALTAQASTGYVDLSWGAVSGATNYRIYRGTSTGVYSQIAAGVTSPAYRDTTIVNGTQYFYVIRSFNGIESANSNEVTAQAIPNFSITSTSALSTSSIQISWPLVAGASQYDVKYGTASGSYTTVSSVTSPYTLNGLSSGTTYYLVVTARNATGAGASVTSLEVTQITPLAAPVGLSASAAAGSVSLAWTATAGASSYKIYRGTVSGSLSEIADGITATSYTDSSVANGTSYFYAVSAYNGADSARSLEASARPMSSFTITATPLSAISIRVDWSAVAGATSYDIKYGTSSGNYSVTLTNETSPTTVLALVPGLTYYFVVVAKNNIGSGTSIQSSEVGATTAFGAPTGLTASSIPGQVNLSWNAVSGAGSYKVLRGTASGSYSEIAADVSSNSYSDSTVSNGTTYHYVVRAVNILDSANSNEASIRPLSSFTLSSTTAQSASQINLAWTASTGAETYDLRYGTAAGSYTTTVTGVTSPHSLTGLTAGTTYYFSIQAKNSIGSGSTYNSNELNARTSPAIPGSLSAAAVTGQIALIWTAASGATNYNIYRSTTSGSGYAQIASAISALTYTDTTIVNGSQYYYVVRANNGTESANSPEATAQSVSSFVISSTSAPSTSTIQVAWPSVTGATVYDIRYGTSTGSYTTTLSGVTSPYTITGLSGATNYFIVVRARNIIGSGSSSQSAEVTQITPLAAPSGLTASAVPGSATLNWNTVSGATNYKVYRGTTSGSYTLLASGITTNSYVDSTAVNGTTYFYAVKAYNGADSADSNEATIRPVANFSIASLTSPTSTTLQVTWSAPAGANTFDVRYGSATGSYTTTLTGVTSPYTITGLNPGTTYYVVVRANNAVGAGTSVTSTESSRLTALGAPTGLTASATPGNVGLNWSNQSGVTSYKVYRGTSSGSLSLLASNVATNAYMDTTAVNGITYFYSVAAFNGSDSAQSSEVTIQPISSFTLTSANSASASSINLVWDSATGATSYDVRYGTSPGVYLTTVSGVTSPYTLSGLSSGTTYYISVQAKNAVGAGTVYNSNERNARTGLGAPTGLTATATPGNVAVNFTAVSGATSYNIYRGTSSGSYSQIASGVTSLPYNDNTVANGTVYFYVVRTFNGIESVNSSEVSVRPVSSFTLSAASATSSATIDVSWNSATGASTYDVRIGTSSGNYATTLTNVTSPHTITGLNPATQYYVTVRANNTVGAGTSVTASELTATTGTAAPTTLAAAAAAGQVNLSWSNTPGAVSYRVFRGTASGSYSQIGSTSSTAYSDTSVSNGTTYYYVVRAFNGIESANSNEASAAPIGSFTISSVTAPTTTTAVVTFGAAAGATAYDVRYGTASGTYSTTASGVSSPYTLTGLAANTTYYIIVRARNSVGSGTLTNTSEASVVTPVSAPAGLAATGGASQVSLSWTAASGATSYKIFRGTVSGSLTELASGVSGISYSDTSAVNGTTYFYAVRSFNGSDSALSTEVSKQPIASPSISSLTSSSATTLLASWSQATGAATYDLRYGTVSGTYTTTLTSVTSPYTITGLTAGQTYYVQLIAKNSVGGGTSVNSAEANGSPNSPPVISAIADQTTESDTAVAVNFTLTDVNNLVSCTTSMSASSANTTLIPNANIVFSGSVPNCVATITPATGQTGTTTITLTATDGMSPTSQAFSITVEPCTVASINWETQPTGMAAGALFGTAPRASLRKADGSLCTTNTTIVSLDVVDDTSLQQDASVTATSGVVPVGGYALFNAARMERAGTAYTVAATQNGVSSIESNTFNVTAGAANKLVFEQEPATVPVSATLIPNPIVRVADLYGNYVSVNNHAITISLQDNNEGATLSGTLSRNTNSTGAATFSNNTINRAGSYILRATSATYGTLNSPLFDVITITPQATTAVIDMLSGPIVHSSGSVDYRRGNLMFGTTYFDGTTNYTWKVVATNSSILAATIRLKRGNSNIASITVPAGTTTPRLFSATVSNGSVQASSTWRLRVEGTSVNLLSSRLVVNQTNAGKSMVWIPLTSFSTSEQSATVSSTTLSVPNDRNFSTWNWDASTIGRVDSVVLWFNFTNAGAGACAALYNKTTNSIIDTEVCSTNTTAENSTSLTIPLSAMPSTGELEIRYRTTSASAPVKIWRGGLLVRLVNIENMLAIQQIAGSAATVNAARDFTELRATSYDTQYGSAIVTEGLGCRAKALTAGSGTFSFKDNGTQVSGTTSPSNITASSMAFSNQSSATWIEAGPIATTNNNNMYLNYAHGTGSFQLTNCLYTTHAEY